MKLKLNSFWLKVLALIIMVIDHVAHYFVTNLDLYLPMRFIGRLAFPIFCFTFVEGFIRTSNKKKYSLRLGIAALIMLLGNIILNHFGVTIEALSPNIFATFFVMSLVLICIEKAHKITGLSPILYIVLGLLLSIIVFLYLEYSIFAVFTILCFYFLHDKRKLQIATFVIGSILICIMNMNIVQIGMIFAAIPLWLYTSEKPKHKMKYLFYVFYPLHIWLFTIIQML